MEIRQTTSALVLRGGRVLLAKEGLVSCDIMIDDGVIVRIGNQVRKAGEKCIDATGCLVLPGIIDIHGDAFERQIMPRPRTMFPLDIAIAETDRQLAANGITTAYHGLTVSWEPGLRSLAESQRIIDAFDAQEGTLLVDNRLHIRWETFAIDEVPAIVKLLHRWKKPLLAFNDHTTPTLLGNRKDQKIRQSAERAMIGTDEYLALVDGQGSRKGEVEAAIEILSKVASNLGIALLAHDELSPEVRRHYRSLGIKVSEFPMNWETAVEAAKAGEHIVFGAPNVVRGGSHNGSIGAKEAISRRLCTVLATDYYYPAALHAALKLADEAVLPLAEAWALISSGPSAAAGLSDRGEIDLGKRADLIVVDQPHRKVLATISGGRVVYRSG